MLGPEPEVGRTPLAELDFWEGRAANLNTLWAQLEEPGVANVISTLEAKGSTFTNPLCSLRDEVRKFRDTANDNARVLRPLRKWITDMNARGSSHEFQNVAETFAPIMHTLYLIWKT